MAASAYHVISKEIENQLSLDIIDFLDTHVCINNPHWQSSGVITFLCKYYRVMPDTLVGSFLNVLFLLFAVISSELHEKPIRNKDWVTGKGIKKTLFQAHHFFDYKDMYVSFIYQKYPFLFKWRYLLTYWWSGTCFGWYFHGGT